MTYERFYYERNELILGSIASDPAVVELLMRTQSGHADHAEVGSGRTHRRLTDHERAPAHSGYRDMTLRTAAVD